MIPVLEHAARRGVSYLACGVKSSVPFVSLHLSGFLECAAQWLAHNETAESLTFALNFPFTQVRVLIEQVVLIKLEHLFLDESF